jgi:hypothetical protein
MSLVSVLAVLVGVLMLVAGAQGRAVRKASEGNVATIMQAMSRYMNISAANPLAIKTADVRGTELRGVNNRMNVESQERMYLSFQYFSDSNCKKMTMSSTQQLNKCYMSGWEGENGVATPTYYYNTLQSSGGLYTITSQAFGGHCKSNGAFKTPLSTTTQLFPTTCTAVGSMWAKAVTTASLPTYPSVEGTVLK